MPNHTTKKKPLKIKIPNASDLVSGEGEEVPQRIFFQANRGEALGLEGPRSEQEGRAPGCSEPHHRRPVAGRTVQSWKHHLYKHIEDLFLINLVENLHFSFLDTTSSNSDTILFLDCRRGLCVMKN